MDALLYRYERLKIDGQLIGLGFVEDDFRYYCTPKNAYVFGKSGVDGVHYCFIEGQDDKVFCVTPMDFSGQWVHLAANSFLDFLKLLAAFGTTDPIPDILNGVIVDEMDWKGQLEESQLAAVRLICKEFNLSPMEHPVQYIRQADASFEVKSIELMESSELEEPEDNQQWRVYYDEGFWSVNPSKQPGKEIAKYYQFLWNEEIWAILSAYVCEEGVVVDTAKLVETKEIDTYQELCKRQQEVFGEEDPAADEILQSKNPFNEPLRPYLQWENQKLHCEAIQSISWNPCMFEENSLAAARILSHYELNKKRGWIVQRMSFPWEQKPSRLPDTLKLTLNPVEIPVDRLEFHELKAYEERTFIHPVTGVRHTLKAAKIDPVVFPQYEANSRDCILPRCAAILSYTLEPDLEKESFQMSDCAQSDRPIKRIGKPILDNPKETATMLAANELANTIIGGADGPTAIFITHRTEGGVHKAVSAVHFQHVPKIDWRMTFFAKKKQEITIEVK